MRSPIIADRVRCKLVYYERLVANATSGSLWQYQFVGNSCYDPNYTGTGGQPDGFDQYALFYGRYRVLASKFSLMPANVGTGVANQAAVVYLEARPSSTTASAITNVFSNPYHTFQIVNFSSNMGQRPLTRYMTEARIFGDNKSRVHTDDVLTAATSASPVLQWFWNIGLQSVDQATTVTGVMYCKVTYYVEFYERRLLADA
jgi:hypothetical protein